MRPLVIVVLLLLIPVVAAQSFEFRFKGDATGSPYSPQAVMIGGLTGYQIAFLIGYMLVIFAVVQQGLYRWGGFHKRLAAGVGFGITIMATAPMVEYIATTGFAATFASFPTGIWSIVFIIGGLLVFAALYKFIELVS